MSTQDDFPMSVVLHFPPSVYQKIGAAEMLPKLLESLKIEDLRCVQFLRNGRVRVSFLEKETRDRFLSEGMRFEDQEIPVTRDGQKVTVVYIRDLPYEVASDDVIDFFSSYGEVLTAERSVAAKFPSLCNGNRILKMILNQDLPYFLSVCGCQCRLWYRGQPIQCFVCREVGHRAQSCPLSGRCRCCHQVGHMARDCGRAWDTPLLLLMLMTQVCLMSLLIVFLSLILWTNHVLLLLISRQLMCLLLTILPFLNLLLLEQLPLRMMPCLLDLTLTFWDQMNLLLLERLPLSVMPCLLDLTLILWDQMVRFYFGKI